jgi:hypothetical protein
VNFGDQAVIWGVLVIGGGSAVAWISFWMKMGAAVSRVDAAERRAEIAEKSASEAHLAANAAASLLGIFREQVAKEYASHQTIREVEDRLSRGIEQLQRSNSEGIRAVHSRLDELLKSLSRLHVGE